MTEHRVLPDSQLHEPKGIVSATSGMVYVADGSNSGVWTAMTGANVPGTVTQGWWDYEDTATTGSPIALTVAGTQYQLTNDGLGTNTTDSFALAGVGDIWDTTTDQFLFNAGGIIEVGDTIDIRADIAVTTTTANTGIDINLEAQVGASPYQLTVKSPVNYKTAGTYQLGGYLSMYIGSTATLNNPARLLARADTTGATVTVTGWYIRVLKNN